MATKLCHKIEVHGKQLKVNGHHWADCGDEFKACVIRSALEEHFKHTRK